jgi:metal-dependent HD superfamily phosphatase/phosphodiesterase
MAKSEKGKRAPERSAKEKALDAKILEKIKSFSLSGKAAKAAELLLSDPEIEAMQEYANIVSIVRLKFNDHGPVHMRTVVYNALLMMELLRRAGVKTSLETEEIGTFEDSLAAVVCGSFLHDFGMSVGRHDHELHSAYLSYPILDRILRAVYGSDIRTIAMIRGLTMEAISGHMGNRAVYSLEAGIVQVADGCDMKKGRARIPLAIAGAPRKGDIHQYSANSIEEVTIAAGKEKPICITIEMSSEVGLYQVEEVLLNKIAGSTAKSYIELYAVLAIPGGKSGEPKRYL